MRRTLIRGGTLALLAGSLAAGAMELDWAYHSARDQDTRTSETVPGHDLKFVLNGTTEIPDGDGITLYILTANQFAGDAEEQVFVRWWNGQEEHWIAGEWVANLHLGSAGEGVGVFRGQPEFGTAMVDLWKVDIRPEITRPGENYYVIQLKAWSDRGVIEHYLIRDARADTANVNNMGQAWTAGADYTGHDWSLRILE